MIYHRIRVKLYPNYISKIKGAYFARTKNNRILSLEDVCSALKTRGNYTGTYEDLVKTVQMYYDELVYQLCDGYAVSNKYYSIHPNIEGTFNSANETHDHKKNPVNLRFGTKLKLRDILKKVNVDIEGVADNCGFIDKFIDYDEDSVNESFRSGSQFAVYGSKIKIFGNDPSIGVYFVSVDDPSDAVKVERIADNCPTKITGIVPDVRHKYNRIEVRTQYSGSGVIMLKYPRTITANFILETA